MKKRKSPHNEIKIDRILHFAMYSTWLLILLFCLAIFKCTIHASSGENENYFPMGQNDNGLVPDYVVNKVYSVINSETYDILIWGPDIYNQWYTYYAIYVPKETTKLYGEIHSNGYQFSGYKYGTGQLYTYAFTFNNGNFSYSNDYGTSSGNFYISNKYSSLYSTSVSYVSNFKMFTNSNEDTLVLKYGWDLPPDFLHNESHATPPDTFESPVYTTGHTPPTNVPPTYTINNYTWTTYTPPTIDTSNAETLLESIYNAIVYNGQYLKDNIHGELTNLVDNIGGFFEYIGDTIQYYGNLIISNIQNGITTFYNNINSAIVGIGNAVGYITQPLDMDNLTNAVNSTSIWGDIDTCTTYASDAFGIYGTVAEPNTFKIPLDLRSISLLNITQVYYIDLSWLDGAKQAIRAFMWCIVTFGLLYSVIVDIPNMIRSSK